MTYREYKSLNLKVKISTNQIDFLDVTFDLIYENFQCYRKNNANPNFIHSNSISLSSVIRHISFIGRTSDLRTLF